MTKSKPIHASLVGAHPRPRLVDAYAHECSDPSCDSPASTVLATQVPLCEVHIMDVYRAANQLLTITHPPQDEYALLPSEQQQIPGACPSCGHAGYLMRTVTDLVRCLNASCQYQVHIVQFEALRRRLLFDLAARRPVVYYIKFRDCVKIGTTRNLKSRWSGLTATEMLYGIEYGDHRLERRRHDKFAPYRTYGEWFEDNQHIRAHINEVCVTAA
jgi:hypothetical protein